jgi:ferredoxin
LILPNRRLGVKIVKELEVFIMAYIISDACTACGTCVDECPVSSITAGDPIYVIDPDTCIDCGACAAVCPSEAINPE